MKRLIILLTTILLAYSLAGCGTNKQSSIESKNSVIKDIATVSAQTNPKDENKNILIVYFSRVGNTGLSTQVDAKTTASINLLNDEYIGNTQLVAQWIQQESGGDIFLIKTQEPYPQNYDETVKRGEGENRNNIFPKLATHINNLDQYDTIILGYPVWAYDLPMPVQSFLLEHNLAGKTILPFTVSGGSSISSTLNSLRKLQPEAKILEGLTLSHSRIFNSKEQVINWIKKSEL